MTTTRDAGELVTDCGPDGGCEECDVCGYLSFLEWAGAVGKPGGSTIQRNERLEAYLRATYPATAIRTLGGDRKG